MYAHFLLTDERDGDDDEVRWQTYSYFSCDARQATSVCVCALSSVIIFSTPLDPIKFTQISSFQEYTHLRTCCSGPSASVF